MSPPPETARFRFGLALFFVHLLAQPHQGHFPGADRPLAVAQIGHTPMDVIVVDEEHRQPIQRPLLTVVIDVYSRMVLGFAIYLEKPSAFTTGLAIAHAVLPKEAFTIRR